MARYKATSFSNIVDLFFKAGASRGRDLSVDFRKAFEENSDLALRLALWTRDVRGGAGERKHFREWLSSLVASGDLNSAMQLALRTPEVGRWDDLLVLIGTPLEVFTAELIGQALQDCHKKKWIMANLETMSDAEAEKILQEIEDDVSNRHLRVA